ncbi:MAG: arginine decarboxylase [Ruminococcus sp.]|nr:arginine decarboxylase [Ruminococcus sp.]
MTTPICDFVTGYAVGKTVRFHMPGHKGVISHGLEPVDITEIKGAGYLYSDEGIIAESEQNASMLFGTEKTLYSTEGSSLSIKTMLAVAATALKKEGERPVILAARNAHKAFIDAAALIDLDVEWLLPRLGGKSICSCDVTPEMVRNKLLSMEKKPLALYITSPDYCGNILDIRGIKTVLQGFDIPLLVDNAHGAYLKFLTPSLHPVDQGADMCADSAHKTLPVYTGGGYLHISRNADKRFIPPAKGLMSMLASTSPSYLIMQSLDICNLELSGEFPSLLGEAVKRVSEVKSEIASFGFELFGNEPMKICILPNSFGYTGDEVADILRQNGVEPEYSDPYTCVLMPGVKNTADDYEKLLFALSLITRRRPIENTVFKLPNPIRHMSIREAAFSNTRRISVDDALGCICGRSAVSCQPSVPIAVSGEEITADIIKILKRYSIFEIDVL